MTAKPDAPYHAHIYYEAPDRARAAALRERLRADSDIRFVGQMTDRGIGPHPIAQYEVHFLDGARDRIVSIIEQSRLRALVHPLTEDDLADHTELAHWIGEPVELDLSVLDPIGQNKGMPRFGVSDF